MSRFKLWFLSLSLILLLVLPAQAANPGFINTNIWLSNYQPVLNETINIYSIVVNDGKNSIFGELVFTDNDKVVGAGIPFELTGNGASRVVSASWTATAGSHRFRAVINKAFLVLADGTSQEMNGSILSQLTDEIFVDVDSDNDGVSDKQENEQGTSPNNPDTDGDGENDKVDPSPTDSKIFNGPDVDQDGIADAVDANIGNKTETPKPVVPAPVETVTVAAPTSPAQTNNNQNSTTENLAPSALTANEPEIQNEEETVNPQVLGVMEENNNRWNDFFWLVIKILAACLGLFAILCLLDLINAKKNKLALAGPEIIEEPKEIKPIKKKAVRRKK